SRKVFIAAACNGLSESNPQCRRMTASSSVCPGSAEKCVLLLAGMTCTDYHLVGHDSSIRGLKRTTNELIHRFHRFSQNETISGLNSSVEICEICGCRFSPFNPLRDS